jgi:hypothetical protein
MSEAKFTKGPWKKEGHAVYGPKHALSKHKNGRVLVCEVVRGSHRADPLLDGGADRFGFDSEADAHLIGAAPEMYAVASSFEIQGPDDDGMVWLVLHGRGTTGRAMVSIGYQSLICAQVALELEADRAAALRKARGEE